MYKNTTSFTKTSVRASRSQDHHICVWFASQGCVLELDQASKGKIFLLRQEESALFHDANRGGQPGVEPEGCKN